MNSLVALALTAAAPAHAQAPLCPPRITVEQRVTDPPAGFQSFDAAETHHWIGVQFSDGPPVELAWLAPDSSRRKGATVINVWRFTPAAGGTWLSCGYTGTSVVLSQRLPDSVRSCEVRYDAGTSPIIATSVACR
ncbi:MAG: STY0301 family protein [Rhodopila sp.]